MLKLVADENMPLLSEFFSGIADVVSLPGRNIKASDVKDADALLVRSVTPVTPALLAQSRVRFVGSATIGTDHLDLTGLSALGIAVASAPGCNARAVGEYVATVLMSLTAEQGWQPESRTLGVVGLGNTGSWVVKLAKVLGFQVIGCDPAVNCSDIAVYPFETMLAKADILSFHVPLKRHLPNATWHLLGASQISQLPAGTIVINSSRGEVVDNQALLQRLETQPDITAVLDVWEGEPCLMPALLEKVRWGSPHVAGYSQEGKWRGTEMIYKALCRHFGLPASLSLASLGLEQSLPVRKIEANTTLSEILLQTCPILRDDSALRTSVLSPNPGQAFDLLRKAYPVRREFPAHALQLPPHHPAQSRLAALGFSI